MTDLIVGDDGCKFLDVYNAMNKPSCALQLCMKWKEIAWELNVPADVIHTIQLGLSLQTTGYPEAYHKILMIWRGAKSSDAKLRVLMDALENVGLKDAADRLRTQFGVIDSSVHRQHEHSPKFIQPPHGLQDFLKKTSSRPSTLMIISTLKLSITLEKIHDTIKQPMHFIHDISLQSLASLKANNLMVVVKCTRPVAELLAKVKQFPKTKLVLVTEEPLDTILPQVIHIGSKMSLTTTVDELSWSDLHEIYRDHLLTQLVLVQEHEITLQMALDRAGVAPSSLDLILNGKALAEIIENETRTLLYSTNLLPELQYYVPRRVMSTARLSLLLISKSPVDIFLFTGDDDLSAQIYKLAKKDVETSRKQILNGTITSRFLSLSLKSDFDDICQMTNVPVHCLNYQDGQLNWVKSRGDLTSVRNAIHRLHHNKVFYDEDEFVNHISSQSQMPVCISDSPGMGKSVLLSTIGRKIIFKNTTSLVQFVTLSKFIPRVNLELKHDENLARVLLQLLAKYTTTTELACKIFKAGIQSGKLHVDLLLDGYDEISSSNIILANKCLKEIIKSFPSIRIIVTTRPHFLKDLEDILQVLGHHIMPFGERDQVQFLTSYWSRGERTLDTNKLVSFSETCLRKLKGSMTRMDRDIAGIPLQCMLVGKVYKREAQKCSDPQNAVSADVTQEIGSITELFQLVVDLHLKRFSDKFSLPIPDRDKWMRRHAIEALKLLFPTHFKTSTSFADDAEADIRVEDLLKVGILVSYDQCEAPQFIHRLFAEFFVAWFAHNQLLEEEGVVSTPLFESILSTHLVEVDMKGFLFELVDVSARTFTHYMILYFLNNLLKKTKCCSAKLAVIKMAACTNLNDILEAGAHDNFEYIFQLFRSSSAKHSDSNQALFDKESLFVSVWQSNVDVLKECFPIFQNSLIEHVDNLRLETYKDNPISLLHVAVCRGDSSVVRFLLNAHNFAQIVANSTSLPLLLHSCVDESDHDNEDTIQGKITILQELVELDRHDKLLKERDIRGRTALLCSNIHLRLLKQLIRLGADVLATDNVGNGTVLHKATQYLSRLDYNELTRTIPQEQLKRQMGILDEAGRTPLHRLISSFDPMQETLLRFSKAGADFNSADFENETVLTTGVRERRTSDSLECLVELGASWKMRGENCASLLHIVLEQGEIESAKLFLELGADVNAKDEDGNTPFHAAIRQNHSNHPEIFKLLLEYKLDLNVNNEDRETYLHLAARHKRTALAALLVEHELDVNARDWRNNTPLHFALYPPMTSSSIAADNEIFEMAHLLIDNRAEINTSNRYDRTPLLQALRIPDHTLSIRTLEILQLPENITSEEAATEALRCLLSTTSSNDEHVFHQLANNYLAHGADLENDDDPQDRSFLHIAALKGTHFAVKFLCEHGFQRAAVNFTDSDGNTPLHLAVQNKTGDMHKIVECLIENGAEINLQNNKDQIPLLLLISEIPENSQVETLVLLSGAEFSEAVATSALQSLISKSWELSNVNYNLKRAESLVAAGADLKFHDEEENSLLHIACRSGCVEAVKFLVDYGISVNTINTDRNTPLHLALLNKNVRLQKQRNSNPTSPTQGNELFQQKWHKKQIHPDLEDAQNFNQENPLIQPSHIFHQSNYEELPESHEEQVDVSISVQLEIVHFLLEREALTNSLNKDYNTPLLHGLKQRHVAVNIDVLQVLLSREESITTSLATLILKHVRTKLQTFKSDKVCLRFLKWLTQHGADCHERYHNNFTILHNCVKAGNLAAFQYFTTLGCDIEATTFTKNTILHLAPEGMTADQFHVLLEIVISKGKGHLVNGRGGNTESTVLQMAVWKMELLQSSLKLFKKWGADFNAVDNEGDSVLCYAIYEQRSTRLIQTLMAGFCPHDHFMNQNCENLLHIACLSGSLSIVKLLTPLISINSVDKQGNTPLHKTIYECGPLKLGIIRELVGKGADVNATDKSSRTPLHDLFLFNRNQSWEDFSERHIAHKVFKYLLAHGADINVLDEKLRTVLHCCAGKQPPEVFCDVVTHLKDLKNTTSFTSVKHEGNFPIHDAVQQTNVLVSTLRLFQSEIGDVDLITNAEGEAVLMKAVVSGRKKTWLTSFIQLYPSSINTRDNYKNSLLHEASRCGNVSALKYLLSLGIDVNSRDYHGAIPLHIATASNNINAVILLINNGSDLNAQDEDGDTPLHYAFELHSDSQYEIAELLIQSGADVDVVSLEGKSTLWWATRAYSNSTTFRRMEIFKLLIERGADLSRMTRSGTTALAHMASIFTAEHFHEILEHAIFKERANRLLCHDQETETLLRHAVRNLELHEDTLELFQQQNLDFNAVDSEGNSVLMHAVFGKRTAQFLAALCQLGADYHVTNHKKENVLHVAAMAGNLEAVQYFLNEKLDWNFVNAKNEEGNTPLHFLNLDSDDPDTRSVILACFAQAMADVNICNNKGERPKII